MRDWKLKSLANGKEISAVLNGKRGLPLEVVYNFRMDFLENYSPFDFQQKILLFFAQW